MNNAAILFSGGSDSTLAAAMFAERFDHVTLLTFDRFSFIGARDYTKINYENLVKIYGKKKISHEILPVGKYHKEICYQNYFKLGLRYKLGIVALAFSKLSMHWRAAEYTLQNGINNIGDGMVPYMHMYTDQNEDIALNKLKEFYKSIGITYENPLYNGDLYKNTEQRLYAKGITNQPLIRGTEKDRQVYYAEQVLFALFLKYYVGRHGQKKYEEVVGAIYRDKIEFIKSKLNA